MRRLILLLPVVFFMGVLIQVVGAAPAGFVPGAVVRVTGTDGESYSGSFHRVYGKDHFKVVLADGNIKKLFLKNLQSVILTGEKKRIKPRFSSSSRTYDLYVFEDLKGVEVKAGIYEWAGFDIDLGEKGIQTNNLWHNRLKRLELIQQGKNAAPSMMDLSGRWELLKKGRPYAWLTLTQTGDSLSGQAVFEKGSASVTGHCVQNQARIKLIYDNSEVLENWLSEKVSRQVVGISSRLDIQWRQDTDDLPGTLYGFYVWWDGSGRVTRKADGGTSAALEKNKPARRTLRRQASPSEASMQHSVGETAHRMEGAIFELHDIEE